MRKTRLNHATLLALIEQVYAAAEDGRLWEPLLLSLSNSVGAAGTALISHDLITTGSVAVQAGIDPEAMTLYNDHYHHVDVWAATGQRLLSKANPTQVFLDDAMVSRHELQKTEYYPYARRYSVSRLMHSVLERDARGIAGISVLRGDADPAFSDREARFLEALTPHLRRGLRMYHVFARAAHDRRAAFDGLDAMPLGVLLVTGEGRVVHANRMAETLLALRDGLLLDKTTISAASPASTRALRRLCADCAATTKGTGLSAGAALSLARPSGRAKLQVLVCPVKRIEAFGVRDDGISAVVFVSDPEQDARPSTRLLQTFYGLTAAEAEVAARLAVGQPVDVISDECGYTKQTVQWYSKQILSKTGCRNRATLVRQLSTTVSSLDFQYLNGK